MLSLYFEQELAKPKGDQAEKQAFKKVE
jgi:hypothetical protein